ncbi:MAG: NUDIX hydrolase [Lachnospiraceae bacterium]|nr:NUDIX hydrolase [Lachnospiraceae bacterium]
MSKYDDLREKQIGSEEVFDGVILHLYKDTVELPNGNSATREVIRHVGAVAVVPVTDKGNVIIERQYRYPFDEVITEIPAGKLDSPTEDPLQAAKRELSEETGYSADEWIDMGIYIPTCAYCDEKIYMYLAKGLHRGEQNLDDDEFLHVEELPLPELVDQVMNGQITDGKTQAGILKAARILKI